MKRNTNQKRRIADNTPRHTRSDHGNAKSNNLYTPPIGKVGRNTATSGGDSALLQRLEKITNEINTMQTYPNQQNQPPNQNYPLQYNPQAQTQYGVPPAYPPSYANVSPRNMEYNISGNESPRLTNDMMGNGNPQQQQQQQQEFSPQSYSKHKYPHQQQPQHGATTYSSVNQMVRLLSQPFLSQWLHFHIITLPLLKHTTYYIILCLL
jgi:hypothetical protein